MGLLQQGYIHTVLDMKADLKTVEEVKSDLPLPEQPPVAFGLQLRRCAHC